MYERKIWCLIGDEYDLRSFNLDVPCKHGGKLFSLEEIYRKKVKGDFHIYSGNIWLTGSLAPEDRPITEDFKISFHFHPTERGYPSDNAINTVLNALKDIFENPQFQSRVRGVVANDKVFVAARTNIYWGH